METQGFRLLKLRKAKKLTQQQLADKIDVSKTSIVWWEHDKSSPKRESLEKLAKELDTTTNFILEGIDGNTAHFAKISRILKILAKIDTALNSNKFADSQIVAIDTMLDTVEGILIKISNLIDEHLESKKTA